MYWIGKRLDKKSIRKEIPKFENIPNAKEKIRFTSWESNKWVILVIYRLILVRCMKVYMTNMYYMKEYNNLLGKSEIHVWNLHVY